MGELRHKQYRDMYHFSVPLPDNDEPAETIDDNGIYSQDEIAYGCYHTIVDYALLDLS